VRKALHPTPKPIYPCTILPAGLAGVLAIDNGKGLERSYEFHVLFDEKNPDREIGYRLIRRDNGELYDLNPEWGAGQWECTCADHVYRSHECKHALAARAALKAIKLI
jgi:hypothetical protein